MKNLKQVWNAGLVVAALAGGACTPEPTTIPTDVELGDTAVVVSVNPQVNDGSDLVPAPGTERIGVPVQLLARHSTTTNSAGLAVLPRLEPGSTSLLVGDGTIESFQLTEGQLREVAVSVDGETAVLMADVRYAFQSAEVIEIDATQSVAQVNEALNGSNRIVLIRGGSYTGDLLINGSNVTLFGEGALGGEVSIVGNVEVNGSGNRIRGAIIDGDLEVDGSDFGLTFSHVLGATRIAGSDAVLLENVLCGGATLDGSGNTVVGNRGLSPLPVPDGAC